MKQIYWEKWVDPSKPEDEEDEDEENPKSKINYLFNRLAGFIPNKHSCTYKFHIGHTNFNFRQRELDLLLEVPGIETLEIITRYRFRVGIGMMFDEIEVKKNIEKALLLHPLLATFVNSFKLPADLKNKLENKLTDDNFVYVLPNLEYDFFIQTDVNVANCINIQKSVNGGIYTKWTI